MTIISTQEALVRRLAAQGDAMAKCIVCAVDELRGGAFLDCGEVALTELAVFVADEVGELAWLCDETHWIWEVPIMAAEFADLPCPGDR